MTEVTKLEYRVRPVERYIVTSYREWADGGAGTSGHGEFDNADTAYAVAYALTKHEHEQIGWPAFDERVTYPAHPSEANATPVD